MPGFMPGIDVFFLRRSKQDMDGIRTRAWPSSANRLPQAGKPDLRDKPGHDGWDRAMKQLSPGSPLPAHVLPDAPGR
jgi:hypothetical protein